MKGFKINIKDKEICAFVNRGAIVIAVEKTYISIDGIDRTKGISTHWGKIDVCVGDKIRIAVSDVGSDNTPISTKFSDRQELLKEYHSLKDFLTTEGRLK